MAKEKNLSDRIRDRVKTKPATGRARAQNLAAFLSVKPDVIQAMSDGWPVKTIWETLHEEGKVTFSYQAFRLYVRRHLANVAGSSSQSPPPTPGQSSASTADTSQPTSTAPKSASSIPGFKFEPTPDLKKLI